MIPALTAVAVFALAGCKCNDTSVEPEVGTEVEDVRAEFETAMQAEPMFDEAKFEELLLMLPPDKATPELVAVFREMAEAGINVYSVAMDTDGNFLFSTADGNNNFYYRSIASELDSSNLHIKDALIALHKAGVPVDGDLVHSVGRGRGVDLESWAMTMMVSVVLIDQINGAEDTETVELMTKLAEQLSITNAKLPAKFREAGLAAEGDKMAKAVKDLDRVLKSMRDAMQKPTEGVEGNKPESSEVETYQRLSEAFDICLRNPEIVAETYIAALPQFNELLPEDGRLSDKEIESLAGGIRISAESIRLSSLDPKQLMTPEYLAALDKLKQAGFPLDGVYMSPDELPLQKGSIIYALPYEAAIDENFVNNVIRLHEAGVRVTMGAECVADPFDRWNDGCHDSFEDLEDGDDDNVMFALAIEGKGASKVYVDGLLEFKAAGAKVTQDLIDSISLEAMSKPEFRSALVDLYTHGIDATGISYEKATNPVYLAALKYLARNGVEINSNFIKNFSIDQALDRELREALPAWAQSVDCLSEIVGSLTTEKAVDVNYRTVISRFLCTSSDGAIEAHPNVLSGISVEAARNEAFIAAYRATVQCYGAATCFYGEIPDYEQYKDGKEPAVPAVEDDYDPMKDIFGPNAGKDEEKGQPAEEEDPKKRKIEDEDW